YWASKTDGKRQTRVWVHDYVVTPVVSHQVGWESPGDYWVYRTVGRWQVRLWMHDEDATTVANAGRMDNFCDDCCGSYFADGGITGRRDHCRVNGRAVNCSKNPPECPDCAKRQMEDVQPAK